MPYFYESRKIKLPKSKDRRRRLTDKDRAKIKEMRKDGAGIRKIARAMAAKCSRRMVQFVLFPDRLEKVKQAAKDRSQSARSYERVKGKKWARTIREHRAYKYKVLKKLK